MAGHSSTSARGGHLKLSDSAWGRCAGCAIYTKHAAVAPETNPGCHPWRSRGTHETLLLDAGVPLKAVAERCGHDPVTLLRNYAKRTRKADTNAASVIGSISKGILGT